jgi:uncharacterized protein
MQRIRKISLCLLIAAALLIPTSAWFLTPTPAQAAPYGEARRYDCDHYDFYAGEIFEQAVADQCTFLVQHLFG